MAKFCLDAGHFDYYNQSPSIKEYFESKMVWTLHLYLKEELEKLGHSVVLTRDDQTKDLSLTTRGQKAKDCDLFLSLHSNAVGSYVNESVDYAVSYALVDDNTTNVDEISKEVGQILAKVVSDTMCLIQTPRTNTRKSNNDRNNDGLYNDNYYGVLHGARLVNVPGVILEHSFHTNTRSTQWLMKDDNLRKLAINEAKALNSYFGEIKKETTPKISTNMSEKEIWEALLKEICNKYGVAGLMGNLKAESGLNPRNLQNNGNNKLNLNDDEFTTRLDNGTYTKETFIKDGYGYGLAQWTYWSRKQSFYEYMVSKNASFGCCKTQIEFLLKEIKGYKNVYTTLQNATSVRQASDVVLLEFERPADQSENVQVKRATYGQEFYDKYANEVKQEQKEESKNDKYYRVRTSWDNAKSQIGAYLILQYAINNCKDGYYVFDWNGNVVYPEPKKEEPKPQPTPQPTQKPTKTYVPGMYKVNVDELNIRSGPGTSCKINGVIKDKGTYTITETKNTHWGKLKSGAGWISIHENYCTRKGDVAATQPTPQPTKKSIETIAREVIQGKWGNGQARKDKLTAAGYNYSEVQKMVNKLLGK